MWIVRFALQRPYTFVIVALLIAIFGGAAIATGSDQETSIADRSYRR
jgi:hypothetical protein